MKKRIALVLIILSVLLAACATLHRSAATQAPALAPELGLRQAVGGAGVTNESVAQPAPSALEGYSSKGLDAGGTGGGNAPTQDRLVIMNADVTVVVANPQAKMDAISQMAKTMGGFVVTMDMGQTYLPSGDTAPQGTISIRVPAEKLDEAIGQIKNGAVEVRNETRSGQDVTSQYTDLQSQLNNLEQAETDLQAIMDEAKDNPNSNVTSKTQDVLSVYNQIVSVRGQIEQIKGQMQYYEQSSSYSLITVTLIAEETIKPIEIGGWKPQGVARDAVQALVKFLQGFVNFLIYLVLLVLPVLIVIFGPLALIAWLIVALVRRRKARKAKAA